MSRCKAKRSRNTTVMADYVGPVVGEALAAIAIVTVIALLLSRRCAKRTQRATGLLLRSAEPFRVSFSAVCYTDVCSRAFPSQHLGMWVLLGFRFSALCFLLGDWVVTLQRHGAAEVFGCAEKSHTICIVTVSARHAARPPSA